MAYSLESERDTRDLDSERIFFSDLSEEAQQKALDKKGISDYRDVNWDILPMAYHYEAISNLSQYEIDENALAFV